MSRVRPMINKNNNSKEKRIDTGTVLICNKCGVLGFWRWNHKPAIELAKIHVKENNLKNICPMHQDQEGRGFDVDCETCIEMEGKDHIVTVIYGEIRFG